MSMIRLLAKSKHRVVLASATAAPCMYSRYVSRSYRVSKPATDFDTWSTQISEIAKNEHVDLILPLSEEVLYLALLQKRISSLPPIFCDDFDTLRSLHHKYLFTGLAREMGLLVPETHLLNNREELIECFETRTFDDVVMKPVYSRFAAHTILQPRTVNELQDVNPTSLRPWVLQEFVAGRIFCAYAVAHEGRLTCLATYPADHTLGRVGPTFAYRQEPHPSVETWVSTLIKNLRYTGQIGIDFVINSQGEAVAIECNPRDTGGSRLVQDDPRYLNIYFNEHEPMLTPRGGITYLYKRAAIGQLLRRRSAKGGKRALLNLLQTSTPVISCDWTDPMPFLMRNIIMRRPTSNLFKRRQQRDTVDDFTWSQDTAI